MLEIMLVVVILAFLTGLGALSMRGGQERSHTRAVASEFAALLEATREQARLRGFPAGLVIPRTPGSWGFDSCSRVEGAEGARVTRRFQWAREHPATQLVAPPAAALPASGPDFDPLAWLGPLQSQHWVLFTPQGRVLSDLARDASGKIHFTACRSYTRGTDDLASAASPYSVSLTSLGQIALTPGFDRPGPTVDPGAGALLPSLVASPYLVSAAQPPQLASDPQILPVQDPHALPPNTEALVQIGRSIQLAVEANDPNGGPLFFHWYEINDAGGFSSPVDLPMTWDPAARVWRGITNWSPPGDSHPGDRYSLRLRLRDGGGLQASLGANAQIDLMVAKPGNIVMALDAGGTRDLYTIKPDGSDRLRLMQTPEDEGCPRWSPDGRFLSFTRLNLSTNRRDLWVCHNDGHYPYKLVDGQSLAGNVMSGSWSPDGTMISMTVVRGTNFDVLYIKSDGTNPTNSASRTPHLVHAGWPIGHPTDTTWSPDGTRLIISGRIGYYPLGTYPGAFVGEGADLWELGLNGSLTQLTFGSGWGEEKATISRVSGRAAWLADGGLHIGTYVPGTLTSLSRSVGVGDFPRWSPDGQSLLILRGNALYRHDLNGQQTLIESVIPFGTEADWRE